MLQPDALTTEAIRKKFKNNFDLCNFAIMIGRNSLLEGSQISLWMVLQTVYDRAGGSER